MTNDNIEGQRTIHPKKFKNTDKILNILYGLLSAHQQVDNSYTDALCDIMIKVIPDFHPHFNHESPGINDKDIVHVLFANGDELSAYAEFINWAVPKTDPYGIMFYAIVRKAI